MVITSYHDETCVDKEHVDADVCPITNVKYIWILCFSVGWITNGTPINLAELQKWVPMEKIMNFRLFFFLKLYVLSSRMCSTAKRHDWMVPLSWRKGVILWKKRSVWGRRSSLVHTHVFCGLPPPQSSNSWSFVCVSSPSSFPCLLSFPSYPSFFSFSSPFQDSLAAV